MKIILFGATGMVGQGVLRECLAAGDVKAVLAVVRTRLDLTHPKLSQLEQQDFTDFSGQAGRFTGFDACFFCLGVSSTGMSEPDYRRVTVDFTLAAARTLADVNPELTFVYVSGQGADSSEHGRIMWARVRGETENALLRLPLRVSIFRPGFIQPLHGITSKTGLYRALYRISGPLLPLLRRVFPGQVTTTELVGRAMLSLARSGSPADPDRRIFSNRGINELAAG